MPIFGFGGCGLSSGAGLGYASDTADAANKKGQVDGDSHRNGSGSDGL